MVRTFATASPAAGTLSVFLINKDTQARDVIVRTEGLTTSMSVRRWVFRATGPDNIHAEWLDRGTCEIVSGQVTATLDPVSITVLDLVPARLARRVPGTLEAEDFDAFHDTTSVNSGDSYRSTPVDTTHLRWWRRLQRRLDQARRVAGVCRGGRARRHLPVVGAGGGARPVGNLRILIDGLEVGPALPIPDTGDWRNWATVSTGPLAVAAGTHRIRIATDTGSFNVNWLAMHAADAAAGSPSPSGSKARTSTRSSIRLRRTTAAATARRPSTSNRLPIVAAGTTSARSNRASGWSTRSLPHGRRVCRIGPRRLAFVWSERAARGRRCRGQRRRRDPQHR